MQNPLEQEPALVHGEPIAEGSGWFAVASGWSPVASARPVAPIASRASVVAFPSGMPIASVLAASCAVG
jgi:hypothetical protein